MTAEALLAAWWAWMAAPTNRDLVVALHQEAAEAHGPSTTVIADLQARARARTLPHPAATIRQEVS